MSSFRKVEPKVDFPALENEVLDLWDRIDAFQVSVDSRPFDREYVFYDGPPFANGSPHYGHILAGVIKDVVPRYWTMRGYRVERRFGWDTHGLPVEMEVEKQLGISGPRQINEYGVDRFNQACRSLVEHTAEEWSSMVRRVGRWVDMVNDYKTMDIEFMESVWWVFRQLWDQGLIYRDFKVLPYSFGATTPLSNFEANLDYRETDDPSITLRLKVVEGNAVVRPGDELLIWTTTPWTLPGNLAVAVGPDLDYVRIDDEDGSFWISESRVSVYWKNPPEPGARAKGSDLAGITYRQPFPHFEEERSNGAFVVILSDEVTTDDGTGLVHMAPAYGEADFRALHDAGIESLVDPVDSEGRFTDAVPEVEGLNVKEADHVLLRLLKDAGTLVRNDRIRHSYPFCYRTGTPLIYKAIPTWFVKVESLKDRMTSHNDQVHWVPEYVGSKRFGNWLEGARDWAISRNRYWGSCIPVWECDSCGEFDCVGSIDDVKQRTGIQLTDLHKDVVDQISWPCSCGGTMHRVPEVLDCWFESGSMPYGQVHYPFENRERFDSTFPAQFIAEGLDQTRGWFYTLHVLGTALFDTPAYQNCVVNGLILAEDGRKMSKSLKNYPDPNQVFDEFGADALRAFLINSPVLRAEPLRFSQDGVKNVVRTVLLPLWNTYSFFATYAEADHITIDDLNAAPPIGERPELDRWIISVLQTLISEVNERMEGYYLYDVVPPILGFIDDLTNWYVRRSRRRFWARRKESTGEETNKISAFATLYEVLTTFAKVLAPVLPFITERLYQDLVADLYPDAPRSVHHCDFPLANPSVIDTDLEKAMAAVRNVVQLGHASRKRHEIKVRQPLAAATVLTHDPVVVAAVMSHVSLIKEELNVKEVRVHGEEADLVDLSAKIDFRKLGPSLGSKTKEVAAAANALNSSQVQKVLDGGSVELAGVDLTADDLIITRTAREGMVVETSGELALALDTNLAQSLLVEGMARDLISVIQQLRKEKGLDVSDRIRLQWSSADDLVRSAFSAHQKMIADEVLATEVSEDANNGFVPEDIPVELGLDRV